MAGEPTEARRVGTRGVITAFKVTTRTFTPLGAVLEVVLVGADLAERVSRKEITEETWVRKEKRVQPQPPPPRQTEAVRRWKEQPRRMYVGINGYCQRGWERLVHVGYDNFLSTTTSKQKDLPLRLTKGIDSTLVSPAYQMELKMIKQIIKHIIRSII